MKKKKIIWISLGIILIGIITGSILISNLTTTKFGKINTIFGVMTKLGGFYDYNSFKGKSISEIREILHKTTIRWSSKPITFSKINNMDIKTSSNQVPIILLKRQMKP